MQGRLFAKVASPALIACVVCVGVGGRSNLCRAQLTPERTYYGVDRPVPMVVRVPVGASATPAPAPPPPSQPDAAEQPAKRIAEVQLIDAATRELVTTAAVTAREAGSSTVGVDMARLFPMLWKRTPPRLLRVQLVVDGRKIGPSVVLQPMVSPPYAPRLDRAGAPMFPPEKERTPASLVFSGFRAYVDREVALDTSKGRIVISLRPDAAPATCWHFRQLVEGGFYTDILVHRIASLAGKPEADIIQTGDPNGTGQGGCGEFIDLEPSPLPHDFGVVSMARFADPNSASSQFMICLNREGTAYLDKRYASFGVVIAGAEVLRAIAASPVGPDNRPKDPPVIRSATLVDAAPFGEGPQPERDPSKREGR